VRLRNNTFLRISLVKPILSLACTFVLSFYLAATTPHTSVAHAATGRIASAIVVVTTAERPSQPPVATVPKKEVATEKCTASWYGEDFHGKTMANGEPFDMHNPRIVAHKTLPKGTKVVITNLENGKSLTAVVKDRGPFKPGRCVDLSFAGAQKLDFVDNGLTKVAVHVAQK